MTVPKRFDDPTIEYVLVLEEYSMPLKYSQGRKIDQTIVQIAITYEQYKD
jgi:hypothetical protein